MLWVHYIRIYKNIYITDHYCSIPFVCMQCKTEDIRWKKHHSFPTRNWESSWTAFCKFYVNSCCPLQVRFYFIICFISCDVVSTFSLMCILFFVCLICVCFYLLLSFCLPFCFFVFICLLLVGWMVSFFFNIFPSII